MLYSNILSLIGNTPIIRLKNIESKYNLYFKLYAKLEYLNPFGSIKDRIGYHIISQLIKNKTINNNTTIIEATSGNTGISLAHVCNYYKLPLIIVMSEKMSKERVDLLRALKAKVILTNKDGGIELAMKVARELNKAIRNSYYINQFSDFKNPQSHYKTGKEILRDIPDITALIVGIGSGGSISGVGKFLKRINPNIKVIGIEPEENPFLTTNITGNTILQGIGTTFIPKILNFSVIDKIWRANEYDSIKKCHDLITEEGIFVGLSSGALLSSIIKNKEKISKDEKVCLLFADNGNKYLSLKTFE